MMMMMMMQFLNLSLQEGYTALHIAVQSGHAEVVEALIGMGAAVQQKAGSNGETPLHTASRIENGKACVEMLIKSGAQINAVEASGETPLHFAAREGFIDTVNLLLEDRANPSMQNVNGENVLHIAVKESRCVIAKRIIEYMVETFAKKNATDLVNQANKVRFDGMCVFSMLFAYLFGVFVEWRNISSLRCQLESHQFSLRE